MAKGEDEGKPLLFRIRAAAPHYATKKGYPKLLAITWRFDPNANNGMPLPDVVERMQQLEDLLDPAFADARQAFLTVVATGNGVREWQWYAKDANAVMGLVNQTLGELDPFPVQFSFQDDPGWLGYARFLSIREA